LTGGGWRHALGRIEAWVWVAALLGALLVLLTIVSMPRQLPGAVLVSKVAVVHDSGSSLAIKDVVLPHVWDDEKPPWSGGARYRVDWPASVATGPGDSVALYFPRIGARFRVWLNGQVVDEPYWNGEGYVDTSVVPHFVALPAALLKPVPADNRLEIEVRGQLLRKSGLAPFSIGPRAALEPRFDLVFWWQVHATWMVAACSVVMALFAGLLWWQSRERVFGFLAVASVAWSLRMVLTPLVNPPMAFELWFYLHKLSYTVYAGFIYLFLWDLFGHSNRKLRVLGLAVLWIGPLWLAVTTFSENYNLYRIWSGVDSNQKLLLVAGAVTVVCGLRDFGVVQLNWPGDSDLRWSPVGSLVFMLMLAAVLVQRTSSYMAQIGQLNRELELRVGQKEDELNSAFQQLREAERRQVLEDERKRLTRDMHDGLGSQLVQTLNVVRSADGAHPTVVEGMLSHALEELRMTLDSLEPLDGDLPTILGMLRRRIAPALDVAGIELDWQVEEVPPLAGFESRGVMHLFRCLQEVFANIIQHARATHVTVRTWTEDDRTLLSVADNGTGLGAGFREGGRGLANIRMRASAMQATVVFTDARPGTAVTFRFAID
jgi:signal transduction histidine kinase